VYRGAGVQFFALVTDYDDTIAGDGSVDAATVSALERLKASGRKLLLVTGREMPELKAVFPRLDLFDRVVAENGALLLNPATGEERALGPPPPPLFVSALRERGIAPLSVGRVIVATREPHETAVLDAIRSLGLELKIVFNKGAVMVLPDGVTKASGMAAALLELGLSSRNAIGVGDAENDHAFLRNCGAAVAVANALPMLKRDATLVLRQARGAGVVELVDRILGDEESLISDARLGLPLGRDRRGREIRLASHDGTVLILGPAGSGSALARLLLERMAQAGFQYCSIDSTGSHAVLSDAASIGGASSPPRIDEGINLLGAGATSLVVNAQGFANAGGRHFVETFLPEVHALRARCGRPHWLVVDEIGQLLGGAQEFVPDVLTEGLPGTVLVANDALSLPEEMLRATNRLLALGGNAGGAMEALCRATGLASVPPDAVPRDGEALYWERDGERSPRPIVPELR